MWNTYGYGFAPMMGFGLGLGLFGWLLMLLWWAFWIYMIIFFARWIIKQVQIYNSSDDSLKILKQRFAKGEINEKEFLEKKKHLS